MSRRIGALAAVAACVLTATTVTAGPATAAAPKTSLTAIWNDFMCTACHEPLPVAQAPEAYNERSYLQGLINQGLTKSQIERAMVAQYGPAVLGKPPAQGFNLTVYILPPAILLVGIAILIVTLPRWRRRARAAAARAPAVTPGLSPADAQRLEDELSHYPG